MKNDLPKPVTKHSRKRKLWAEIEALRTEVDTLNDDLQGWRKLRDPVALHESLSRGVPARLNKKQLRQLIGEEPERRRWVRKTGGSFEHTGTVVAEFVTEAGERRLVVEFDAPVQGMLHICRPDQVESMGGL